MKINPIALFAGILMLALPFLGAWWIFGVGELFVMKISPFNVNILVAGESVESPLLQGITNGVTLLVLITGVLVLLGSFFVDKWWGPKLIRFGSYRILFMVIGLAVIVGLVLPAIGGRLNQMLDLPINLSIPVQGEEIVHLQQEGISLAVGVHSNFTEIFFIACVIAALGVYSRIYLNKMLKESSEDGQQIEDEK